MREKIGSFCTSANVAIINDETNPRTPVSTFESIPLAVLSK